MTGEQNDLFLQPMFSRNKCVLSRSNLWNIMWYNEINKFCVSYVVCGNYMGNNSDLAKSVDQNKLFSSPNAILIHSSLFLSRSIVSDRRTTHNNNQITRRIPFIDHKQHIMRRGIPCTCAPRRTKKLPELLEKLFGSIFDALQSWISVVRVVFDVSLLGDGNRDGHVTVRRSISAVFCWYGYSIITCSGTPSISAPKRRKRLPWPDGVDINNYHTLMFAP